MVFCKINQVSYILGILFGCLEETFSSSNEGVPFLAASSKSFGDSYSVWLDNVIDIAINLTYFNQNFFPGCFGGPFFLSIYPAPELWLFIAVSHKAL